MGIEMTKKLIADGKAVLGIEFGSTRIKAVLIDEANAPIAEGAHEWENRLDHGIWTYTLEDIWTGLQDCYADLVKDVQNKYGLVPTSFAAIGISAMMHTPGTFPYLEKYHYRTGGGRADRAFQLQYSPALEYCPPVPGHSE